MQPYEIRQLRDGTIDCNNYHARPIALMRPLTRLLPRTPTAARSAASFTAALAVLALAGLLAR